MTSHQLGTIYEGIESYLVTRAMFQSDHWVMWQPAYCWSSLASWSTSSGDVEGGRSWLKETNLHCNYSVVCVNRFVSPKSLPVAMVYKVGTTTTATMGSFSGKQPIQQPNWFFLVLKITVAVKIGVKLTTQQLKTPHLYLSAAVLWLRQQQCSVRCLSLFLRLFHLNRDEAGTQIPGFGI